MRNTHHLAAIRRAAQSALALVLAFNAGAAQSSMALVVAEKYRQSDQDYKQILAIEDVLGEDSEGNPVLKIYPERDPNHQALVDLLVPGMPFESESVRSQIASILRSFPDACRNNIIVSLIVSPVEHIDTWIPNVKDKRRVGVVSVGECLEVQPIECSYKRLYNGAFDFGINSLKRILRECSETLDREIRDGALLTSDGYRLNPKYATVKEPLLARKYFRTKRDTAIGMPAIPNESEALAFVKSQPDWHRCWQRFDFTETNINACLTEQANQTRLDRLPCSARAIGLELERGRYRLWTYRNDAWVFELPRDQDDDCRNRNRYDRVRSDLLKRAADQINTAARVQAYERGWIAAQTQIVEMRHEAGAASANATANGRSNAEASYYLGCLAFPHVHAVPAVMGPAPQETDAEHPYQCAFYAENDYRGVFFDNALPNRGKGYAKEYFEIVATSDDRKLAARAHWNLALLASEADTDDKKAPARLREHLAKARQLDPAAFREQ